MKRVLGGLIRLFPAPFRAEFGAEITAQVAAEWDVARRQGLGATARYAASTGFDLFLTASGGSRP